MTRMILALILLLLPAQAFPVWGFHGHRLISRLAVYSLPPEMLGFFKKNIDFITENAVNPDRRRYAVQGEAERHFIDFDNYSEEIRARMPSMSWEEAVEELGEKTLRENGIVPWQILRMKGQLTEAFRTRNASYILRTATDLSHYIADSNVPLHTTGNYNGQLTNQHGLHAFWESRLPELYSQDYDLFIGKAEYVEDIEKRTWAGILNAHATLDSVFNFESYLTETMASDKKFTIDERNGITVRAYSREFSRNYHEMLDNQVERQMKASIKMIADVWFTCWVDAGQPDLDYLPKYVPDQKEEEEVRQSWLKRLFKVREESDY